MEFFIMEFYLIKLRQENKKNYNLLLVLNLMVCKCGSKEHFQ